MEANEEKENVESFRENTETRLEKAVKELSNAVAQPPKGDT